MDLPQEGNKRVKRAMDKRADLMMPHTGRLVVRDLACERGGRELLSHVSFDLAAGEALSVVGHNGAGKTTFLRVVAGLLRPVAGSVTLEGGDPELSVAEQAHYLGHRDALKPSLSVRENLDFFREFPGGVPADPAEALEAVGLTHISHLPAGYLSAGQRRRLSIARLLVLRRPLWLLDEPTSALDAAGRAAVARLMAAHLAQGGMIIAATHGPLGIPTQELRIGETVDDGETLA